MILALGFHIEGCLTKTFIFSLQTVPASDPTSRVRVLGYLTPTTVLGDRRGDTEIPRAMARTGPETVRVRAGAAVRISSQQLEAGDPSFTGRFGDGVGKWRLAVSTRDSQPLEVMSLLSTNTGHLTNLSR